MANRKSKFQKSDFATKLERLGFEQLGSCTFYGKYIKIFRTNKTSLERKRYWEIRDLTTDETHYRSIHVDDILNFLQHCQFFVNGAEIKISINNKPEKP
jgi:hypothetical protein